MHSDLRTRKKKSLGYKSTGKDNCSEYYIGQTSSSKHIRIKYYVIHVVHFLVINTSTTAYQAAWQDTHHTLSRRRSVGIRTDRDRCLYTCSIQSAKNWKLLPGTARF
jgi:hypothetical protein